MPGTSSATMQLISQIEVGKTDRFLMIVVKHNSIVFGSKGTLNAVDSHAWKKSFKNNESMVIDHFILRLMDEFFRIFLAEFLKVADTQMHVFAKFSTNCAKFWLLKTKM